MKDKTLPSSPFSVSVQKAAESDTSAPASISVVPFTSTFLVLGGIFFILFFLILAGFDSQRDEGRLFLADHRPAIVNAADRECCPELNVWGLIIAFF